MEQALRSGIRGLPGGSSVAQLLAKERGARNIAAIPDLTEEQILEWADAHFQSTGEWPRVLSGPVIDAPGEDWRNIQAALVNGSRCLPGGSSLAQLFAEKRRVRNIKRLSPLTIEQILTWADTFYDQTKAWPGQDSGVVEGAPSEKWSNIEQALMKGLRGLPGGSSLARLLAEERGVRNSKRPPMLTIQQILAWADTFHQRTGRWPSQGSGEVEGVPGEKWGNIDQAFVKGFRGLPGGSSLAQALKSHRGTSAPNDSDLAYELDGRF